MNYEKPIRYAVLGLCIAGAGLAAGGKIIYDQNRKQKPEEVMTGFSNYIANNSPEGQKAYKLVNQMESDIKKEQKQSENERKQLERTARYACIERETKSDLEKANSDLERKAIIAYALARISAFQANDVIDDAIDIFLNLQVGRSDLPSQ